jgi:xanthine dehydrogenase accessory factor
MSEPTQTLDDKAVIDTLTAAGKWLSRDGRVALLTVVDTWGSAPVPVGGQMVVAADGQFQGSVSGGCIEGEVITAAAGVLASGKPQILSFGVEDETAWSVGLPCGGQVKVYIERLERDASGRALIDAMVDAQTSRRGLVVQTNLKTGVRTLFKRDAADLAPELAQRFRTGKSTFKEAPDGAIFTHALLPPARIVVIGATHIAQLLCEIARLAHYEVQVVDPRTAFASADRFKGVTLHTGWPQDVLPGIGIDPYTALVVVAHVAHIDDEALKIALQAAPGADYLYVGALGSQRNHTKRTERLLAAGFAAADIARIKCPIGLDIGAQTPAEIAVSIMAEVIHAVRGPKAAKSAQASILPG